MNWLLLCRYLGLLGMLVGGSMAISLPWSFPLFGQTLEFEVRGFWGMLGAIACSLAVGGGLYLYGRRDTSGILRKEAFAIVGLGWVLAGGLGSLPYLFTGTMRDVDQPMGVADALFESVSGFSTTGATVLTQLEDPALTGAAGQKLVPRCVLFWRSFTQWLGGMGIVVLFVAILGQLGAGGKALMRREVTGPLSNSVRPRVRETALVMWTVYVVISGVLVVLLLLEGMNTFDALCHSFACMATGGFSTRNASLGHYNSLLIELTVILFMIAAGVNFSLYYVCTRPTHAGLRGPFRHIQPLFRDPEFRVYIAILLAATVTLTFSLWKNGQYPSLTTSLRHAAFHSVTIMTTTGFGTEDFTAWSEFSKGLLLLLMFIGGSAGSTAGGMKVIRFMLFAKVVLLEIEHAFRPNVVRPLRIAGRTIDNAHRHQVMVYFSLVLLIFISSWMILAAIEPESQWQIIDSDLLEELRETHPGIDDRQLVQDLIEARSDQKLLDCASAVAATLNNIGPGFGVLGPHQNYAHFSAPGKSLLTLLMLLGRLELFAILVLFMPSFWRSQ